jgi:hypothetical protein
VQSISSLLKERERATGVLGKDQERACLGWIGPEEKRRDVAVWTVSGSLVT